MSGRSRPQSASPWVIDTRVLGRRPGTLRAMRLAAPVDEQVELLMWYLTPDPDVSARIAGWDHIRLVR